MSNERPGMTATTTLSELPGDYVLHPARTRIGFAARQAIVTRVRGQFGEFEGTAHLDGDDPSKSRARITIQAASIQTSSQRRDDHPRSAFLHVSNHPAITFAPTGGAQPSETTLHVPPDLTTPAATKPLTLAFQPARARYD